jgi:hypothetical protein
LQRVYAAFQSLVHRSLARQKCKKSGIASKNNIHVFSSVAPLSPRDYELIEIGPFFAVAFG